ncbi:MAG TPA: HlyD family efflux transporter periplasmic adaptor subunit [Candidatus Saccharimonadales bacterium]|nr:HlyD family efflux transporter periplasmic adaptor subunit [Candidatus Saccharimonadales bacterium]
MARNSFLNSFHNPFNKLSFRDRYKSTTSFIKRRPLGSFFIALGLLFLVIILGRILNQPKTTPTPAPQPKSVQLYSIGEAPKVMFEAKVEKAGTIKIVAQTSGIVQSISVKEGSNVNKGQQLISLATNYQGDSAPGVQAQIAQNQYQNVLDTYGAQEDAINQQRNIANATFQNYNEQQSIASQSASNTNSLINSNQTVLNALNQQLTTDQNNNVPAPTLIPEESEINTLQGAQNQLRSSLSSLQEQTDSGKAPGLLAQAQQNLALDQLNVQEKALQLNKEVTQLQAELAAVNEDTMLPSSPVDGVVQRVFVHVGDQVSTGTELAVITAAEDSDQTIAVVEVPAQIAQNISKLEPSELTIGDKNYNVKPFFVSASATDGLLYSVFYAVPKNATSALTDGEYVNVNIPVGAVKTGSTVPFVPIDSVYQTQDSNYLLLDENNKAVSQKVTLGNVFGNFVEIKKGLSAGNQVILDRSVVAGDKVKTN